MSTMHFVMYANSNFLSGDEGSRGGEMTSENQYSWSYQISSSWSYFSILQHNIVQWDFLLRPLDQELTNYCNVILLDVKHKPNVFNKHL